MNDPELEPQAERPPMSPWKRIVLGTLVTLVVASAGARAFFAATEPAETPRTESAVRPDSLTGGLPDILNPKQAEPEPEPTALESALPVLSEASFFALIGFALGYASRKVVKLMLIFVAIFFVGIQALSFGGVLTVDWSKAVDLLNDLILNLKENETISEVLKDRVPTFGALVGGYFLGFRKG